MKRRAAALYVLTESEAGGPIWGYYTLSACSVHLSGIAASTQKKLARYPEVAGALIGRLAVDTRHKGGGLGATLLRHALHRCLEQSRELAMAVVVVDALNETAQGFYERYGFQVLGGVGNRLYLPIATIEQAQAY